jgi:hypothetical protein
MSATRDEEELGLRLRVEQLEAELERVRGESVGRAALLDVAYRSRWWRAAERFEDLLLRLRRDPARAAAAGRGISGLRVPLAGQRLAPRTGGGGRWEDAVTVAGVTLPALLADPPFESCYVVDLVPGTRIRAFAALRPGAWLGNRGGVRFVLRVDDVDGAPVAETQVTVDPAARAADRRWVEMALVAQAAGVHRLVLRTEVPEGAEAAFAWAVWGDPVFDVPGAARDRAAPLRRPAESPGVPAQPCVSFLLPVHDPDVELLGAALRSVREQESDDWQLCVTDDGSADLRVRELLAEAAQDPRVVLTRHDESKGISAATNSALALARAPYVATLDHDDVLAPTAVETIARTVASVPGADMVYTDNDKLSGNVRFAAALKPGWSPEYLRACMYTLHLAAYRTESVRELGGWRSEFDGAQDHDLVLRLAERGGTVVHVPELAYSWRVHAASAALGADAKPAAFERGCRAVQEHLDRTGIAATAERLPIAGRYRVVHALDAARSVSIVLPVDDDTPSEALADAVTGLIATHHEQLELVLAVAPGAEATVAGLTDGSRVRAVSAPERAWPVRAVAGVQAVRSEIVVVFEDPCAPETEDWLAELVGLVSEPHVAAAGGLVVDATGVVVHAGMAFPLGLPLPVHPDASAHGPDVADELTMVTNRSSAAGVVALARQDVLRPGAFPSRLDRLALAGLTYGLCAPDRRVVVSPHARLRLTAPAARAHTVPLAEIGMFPARHPDPYYNPRFWPDRAAHVVPRRLRSAGLLADRASLL